MRTIREKVMEGRAFKEEKYFCQPEKHSVKFVGEPHLSLTEFLEPFYLQTFSSVSVVTLAAMPIKALE